MKIDDMNFHYEAENGDLLRLTKQNMVAMMQASQDLAKIFFQNKTIKIKGANK